MKLKNKIRKTLIETKERQDNFLIEQEIIKSRIIMIFEGDRNIKNFNLLSEEKKVKYSFKVLTEMAYQSENGVLNEQLLGILKTLFGTSIGGGFGQALLEPALNFILSGLGMGDSIIKKFVISFLTKKEGFWNMFKDCGTLTKAVAESIVEALVMKGQQSLGKGGFWFDALRNTIGDAGSKLAMVENLENRLADKVCKYFGMASGNAKKVLDKVKSEDEPDNSSSSGGFGSLSGLGGLLGMKM